jgi:hypothetical protein
MTDQAPELHASLLALHKSLLEAERREYEKHHGRLTPHQFLDALLHNPTFAWLQPLTTLLVALDEADAEAKASCVSELRELLGSADPPNDFHQRYAAAVQRSPELAFAHGVLMRALNALAPAAATGSA